jgi:hypothetical protein
MKYTITTFILAGCLPFLAFSQGAPGDAGAAIARLEWARKNRPVESVHLHFDKPYYSLGDTIYFKAYVTMNEQHRPTPLSEVLHVDLIGPGDRIIESVKLPLKQGCAFGDLTLADSLAAGRYRVRAYTRWMRNEGAGAFFDGVLAVGSTARQMPGRVTEQTDTVHGAVAAGADIQFFPEGGELITGIETKVAFKAVGRNGLGVKVRGVVVDDAGKEITRFQAVHLGMGFFYLRSEAGKSYRATVSFADGSGVKVELPKVSPGGIVLAAENDSMIHVLSSESYLKAHPNEGIAVLICSNGSSSVARVALSGGDIPFLIDKRRMHPGITRVTLFSARGVPVSERLVFIKGPDSMNLAVHGDKASYGKRERVEVSIDARDQAGGAGQANFSVSVINEDLLKPDENSERTIFSDLLLCSDLRGYIEQSNYYFAHSGDEVDANLDLLMLTQGYRHFVWKDILRDSLPPLAFRAEKYLQIQGFVRTSAGKPVRNETITLTDTSGHAPEQTVKTDDEGRFAFTNLVFTDTMRFLLHPARSGSRVVLSGAIAPAIAKEEALEGAPGMDAGMGDYLNVAAQEHQIRGAAGAQVLKPALVQASGKKDDAYRTLSLAGAGNADQVLHSTDFQTHRSLGDALAGRLNGVTISRGAAYLNSGDARLSVVLDGLELDPMFSLNDIRVADVATVELLRSANASIYGVRGGAGVLVITTKSGDLEVPGSSMEQDGLLGIFVGFYKSREFYSPRYDLPTGGGPAQDIRSTAFWRPELITDKDGKASFSFYNPDLKGTYRLVVEGIDANGDPGRRVYRYIVQ